MGLGWAVHVLRHCILRWSPFVLAKGCFLTLMVILMSLCMIQGPLEPPHWVGNRALEPGGRR